MPTSKPAPMLKASCHCGAVTVEIPRRPRSVTNCDCSICRRYGTLWAYYSSDEVKVNAAPDSTVAYAWGAKSLRFVRCSHCGCVTHWEPTTRRSPRMGVNVRNFDPVQLGPVRIRRLDGALTEKYLD